MDDLISRHAAIDTEGLDEEIRCEICRNPMHTSRGCDGNCTYDEKLYEKIMQILDRRIKRLTSAQPELEKYEYHYDHTDCIWYRPEARNRCPTTCAQYRDGWNDAMNYIFRDGKGYRPFRRDRHYEE